MKVPERFPTSFALKWITLCLYIHKNYLNTIIKQKGITNSGVVQSPAYIYIVLVACSGLVKCTPVFLSEEVSQKTEGRSKVTQQM